MRKLVIAVAFLGSLLIACGAAPTYSARQALADLPDYEHAIVVSNSVHNNCMVDYLFHHLSPGQVRTVIHESDFGDPPPPLTAADLACASNR